MTPIGTVDGGIVIAWQSVMGETYAVDLSTNLAVGFDARIAPGIPATPPLNVYTDMIARPPSVFYRVRMAP
jgi:hypothetical protein